MSKFIRIGVSVVLLTFIASQIDKIARIRRMIGGRDIRLEVDGGVSAKTAPACIKAGADVLVAGSAVFGGGRHAYAANIAALRAAAALPRSAPARRASAPVQSALDPVAIG